MKFILIIIFCLFAVGCVDKEIGTISISDKDGCLAMFKLKKDPQHICIIETCLVKTEIKFPGNPIINVSELFKEKYGTTTDKISKDHLPSGWKLQYNEVNQWRVLKPSGAIFTANGYTYRYKDKQEAINDSWESIEREDRPKKEDAWHDYKEEVLSSQEKVSP